MYGNRISKRIRNMYRIEINDHEVIINTPAYIQINIDNRFKIENTKHVIRVINDKVHVTLWKRSKFMHITVFK